VLGIDILVDQDLNPWLLESNNNPSFNIEHEPCAKNAQEAKKELSPVD
jgi:D-alanine-D-alanine ligase-like ATP-grasp enzyme